MKTLHPLIKMTLYMMAIAAALCLGIHAFTPKEPVETYKDWC